MRIYIMRHGPAEASAPTGRDFDRALTPAGRGLTAVVARELVGTGESPDAIFASPLRRTQETANIVAAALGGVVGVTTRDELAPGEESSALLREVLAGSHSAALLVGHEPDVSELSSALLGIGVRGFEPAMIIGIDVDRGRGHRRFVLRPSELRNG